MAEAQGIGVMERSYRAAAPGGYTWDRLANAAGKQHPGVSGVSGQSLRSSKFLQGDGGYGAVKWLSPKAYELIKDLLPDPASLLPCE